MRTRIPDLHLKLRHLVLILEILSKDFGIDAGRMESDGKAKGQPVADNNTLEGKADNRRVEFVKL